MLSIKLPFVDILYRCRPSKKQNKSDQSFSARSEVRGGGIVPSPPSPLTLSDSRNGFCSYSPTFLNFLARSLLPAQEIKT